MAAVPCWAWADDGSAQLLGSWGGFRNRMADHGVALGATYIGETFGVLSGGTKQGWLYEGRFEGDLDLDLDKIAGWSGAVIHASAYQIHHAKGRPAADYTGSIGDPSNIEARATLRLFTLWFEQTLVDDKFNVRFGQIAADDEFLIAPTALSLLNGAFAWAPIVSANQVQGGPAYPLASPGVRLKIAPSKSVSLLGAVFFGDVAGHGCVGDPQGCNRDGTTFSFSGEPLYLLEVQWDTSSLTGRPGTVKLGGWYSETHGDFGDQRFSGTPDERVRNQNWGAYGIVDQTLWQDSVHGRALNVFGRAGFAPKDRNLVQLYVDGGFGVTGLWPSRPEDKLTFGVGYSQISGDAADFDRDQIALSGLAGPVRNDETIFELAYTAQITPWLILQPDLQYIVHPGGNVPNADDSSKAVKDAFITALRFTITL